MTLVARLNIPFLNRTLFYGSVVYKRLGTGQYLWEYGTGKFSMGPPVIFTLRSNGATGYFEASVNGATGYFNAEIIFKYSQYGAMDYFQLC